MKQVEENKIKDFVNQFGYGRKVKIKIKKKLVNGEILKTEQLPLSIPKVIFDELNWEEGTLVEWETDLHLENGKDDKVRILLRNVDDKILGDT